MQSLSSLKSSSIQYTYTTGCPDEFVNLYLIINWSTAFWTSFPKLLNRLFYCDREVISSRGLFRLSIFVAIDWKPACKRIWCNDLMSNPKTQGPESLEYF